jgi:hypothetical protein
MNEFQQKHGQWIAKYLKENVHDVLVSRGQKYNGEDFEDPFKQFKDTAYLTFGEINEETIDHAIRYMINHKITRLANNRADFDDESRKETLRDIIGYTVLYVEWLGTLETPKDLPTEPGTLENKISESTAPGMFGSFKKYILGGKSV